MAEEAKVATAEEESEARRPWEPLDGETHAAFGAFEAFRDLGRDRNMDAAYRKFMAEHRPSNTKTRAESHWWEWKRKYNWDERARAYDRWAVAEATREREAEHVEELRQFLDDTRQIAKLERAISIRMLTEANVALGGGATNQPKQDTLTLRGFPNYVQNAVRAAQAASEQSRQAMALEELMDGLVADEVSD